MKSGKFDVSLAEALQIMALPNPHGKPNSDVILPWSNGRDVVQRPSKTWIIDFGVTMTRDEASLYEKPYAVVKARVEPERRNARRENGIGSCGGFMLSLVERCDRNSRF